MVRDFKGDTTDGVTPDTGEVVQQLKLCTTLQCLLHLALNHFIPDSQYQGLPLWLDYYNFYFAMTNEVSSGVVYSKVTVHTYP
jgi:hypothetical protein